MLPIVDKPVIQYVVERWTLALRTLMVIGKGKRAIESISTATRARGALAAVAPRLAAIRRVSDGRHPFRRRSGLGRCHLARQYRVRTTVLLGDTFHPTRLVSCVGLTLRPLQRIDRPARACAGGQVERCDRRWPIV
jgi:hypothetical protein